jgi:hypothetical protein
MSLQIPCDNFRSSCHARFPTGDDDQFSRGAVDMAELVYVIVSPVNNEILPIIRALTIPLSTNNSSCELVTRKRRAWKGYETQIGM